MILIAGGMEGGWMWPYALPRDSSSAGRGSPRKADWQLGAKLVAETDSGHFIQVERPRLVIDAIREVLDAVHAGVNRLAPSPANLTAS